jgi:hypothetical protein
MGSSGKSWNSVCFFLPCVCSGCAHERGVVLLHMSKPSLCHGLVAFIYTYKVIKHGLGAAMQE